MSLLLNNGRKAELRRGLQFIEIFNSKADVLINGGEITGSPVFNASDNSLTFDKTLNQVLCYSDNLSMGYDSFTVRFKAKDLVGIVGDVSELVGNRAWATGNEVGWGLGISSNSLIWLHYSDGVNFVDAILGAGYSLGSIPSYTDIAVTITRGGNAEVFIDGVSKGTKSIAGITGSVTSTEPLCIMSDDSLNTRDTSGTIKDIQIFREILTDSEILAYADGSMWKYMRNNIFFGVANGTGSWIDLKDKTVYSQSDVAKQASVVIGYNGQPALDCDRGDYIDIPTTSWPVTDKISFAIMANPDNVGTQFFFGSIPIEKFEIHNHVNYTRYIAAGVVVFLDGSSTKKDVNTIIGVSHDNTINIAKMYMNGIFNVQQTGMADFVLADFPTIRVGTRGNGGLGFSGKEQYILFFNIALNNLQFLDLNLYINEFKIP